MDRSDIPQARYRLAQKLTAIVLLASLVLELVFTVLQITLDVRQLDKMLDIKARQLLAVADKSAGQTAAQRDRAMAEQLLTDLLTVQDVREASIHLVDGQPMATVKRQEARPPYAFLSDALLLPARSYQTTLHPATARHNDSASLQASGILRLVIDTSHEGQRLLQRAMAHGLSALVHMLLLAAVLGLIYRIGLPLLASPRLAGISPRSSGQPANGTLDDDRDKPQWLTTPPTCGYRQQAKPQHVVRSHRDPLTRLPSRTGLQTHLAGLLKSSEQSSDTIAVICLGLDDYKSLNAQFNFNVAEQVLLALCAQLQQNSRPDACIGRLGEDQFAVILAPAENPDTISAFARELLNCLSTPVRINQEAIAVSATAGISLYPDNGDSVDTLLQQAEQAMIMAKSRSHNRYQFYAAQADSEVRQRRRLEMDLHQALEQQQFSLAYQPQVDLQNQKLVGVEALLRWQHPDQGWVSPDTFIPMAENNLAIIPIGYWVLEKACQQLAQWHQAGYPGIHLAVNLSAVQLRDKQLPERIAALLEQHRIDPQQLEIEVTETFILEDIDLSARQLGKIRDIGITLALDDFGTGYASLSYLKQLPFGKIKIDKSFVEGLPGQAENAVIIAAIIQLARHFKLTVLAEGIETRRQGDYLQAQGCHLGQGYYYGHPMSAQAFIASIMPWRP